MNKKHIVSFASTFISFIVLTIFSFLSCGKVDLEDSSDEGKVPVCFQIGSIEQVPFENTSTRASLSSYCTHFTVAVFQGDTKVSSVSQTSDDASFGTVSMSLLAGTYQLVAIAHNGAGHCTVSTPEKITFYNNKMTDTFYYDGTLTVTEACTESLSLKRAVSMFRLNITDNLPAQVTQMKFYYTGGSSTLDAVTGYGCVNSRQTEIFDVSESSYGKPSTFEVYTFPHALNDSITLKVTALDKNGSTVAENSYADIPIQKNVITQHSCAFFSNVSTSVSRTASFSVENEGKWDETHDY